MSSTLLSLGMSGGELDRAGGGGLGPGELGRLLGCGLRLLFLLVEDLGRRADALWWF
jgi:hypothetical protein